MNSGRYAHCSQSNDKSVVHLATKKTEKGRITRTIRATVIGVFLTSLWLGKRYPVSPVLSVQRRQGQHPGQQITQPGALDHAREFYIRLTEAIGQLWINPGCHKQFLPVG
jgi:hypothetical protein